MIQDWSQLKALAFGLNLPEVTIAHPWGHEVLKAHGRMWCYWAALADGAPFKASPEEREMLLAADPDTFFLHPHYTPHGLILDRGVGDAAVDEAEGGEVEERGGLLGVLEDVGGGLVDRHGA